jgi:Lon protease-like protein
MLIRDGSDVGEARLMEVGTRARITDWYQGSDGILGVTAMGTERFTLQRAERQADGLYLGTVTALPADPPAPLPEDYRSLASLLEAVIEDLGKLYEPVPKHYDDAGWVAARFAEILPIELEQKQQCLEMEDPIERLEFIRPLLRSIRQEPSQ